MHSAIVLESGTSSEAAKYLTGTMSCIRYMKFDKTNYTIPPSFPWPLLCGSVFASRSYSVRDEGPSLCYELETLARRGRVSNRF